MPQLNKHHAHWPAGVPHTLDVPDRNIFDHLPRGAERHPERTAIDYYGRPTTYRALHDGAVALAGYLQQHLEVRRGDRVLLVMQPCPQFVMAYYAVLRCDAVVVALSPMTTDAELRYYADDSGARVAIAMQDFWPQLQPLLDDRTLEGAVVGAYSQLAGRSDDVPFMTIPDFVLAPRDLCSHPLVHEFMGALAADIAPLPSSALGADLAVIAYTSGTTGKAKGAMMSHRSFVRTLNQRIAWMGFREDDTELTCMPLNHMGGMAMMNVLLAGGRTQVQLSRWDAGAAVELLERRRVRVWGGVTPMIVEVLAQLAKKPRDLSSLRYVLGGATPIPQAVADEIKQRFGLTLIESYGMTETCSASHVNPPQAPRRQCAGIPWIDSDARVIDPVSGEELGPGQQGEIVLHTQTLFDGYWNMPQATTEAFIEIDGKRFLRSGDIGYHDEDGYFYIVDRLKRMINASGLKVWPSEVESWMYGHPAVQEACVIAAADARRGETVKAFVVLRPEARRTVTSEQLVEWARGTMAAYKAPRLVEIVDSLPKTPTGKVLWRVLQQEQNERDQAPVPLL